jgi:hypothetical protein
MNELSLCLIMELNLFLKIRNHSSIAKFNLMDLIKSFEFKEY